MKQYYNSFYSTQEFFSTLGQEHLRTVLPNILGVHQMGCRLLNEIRKIFT